MRQGALASQGFDSPATLLSLRLASPVPCKPRLRRRKAQAGARQRLPHVLSSCPAQSAADNCPELLFASADGLLGRDVWVASSHSLLRPGTLSGDGHARLDVEADGVGMRRAIRRLNGSARIDHPVNRGTESRCDAARAVRRVPAERADHRWITGIGSRRSARTRIGMRQRCWRISGPPSTPCCARKE